MRCAKSHLNLGETARELLELVGGTTGGEATTQAGYVGNTYLVDHQ